MKNLLDENWVIIGRRRPIFQTLFNYQVVIFYGHRRPFFCKLY